MSHMPDADLYDTIADLERRIYDLETAPRLTSASIGQGGLRVRGGRIEILDGSGDVTMTLATDGLTLAGLLQVAGGIDVEGGGGVTVGDGGSIDVEGGGGVTVGDGGSIDVEGGTLVIRDGSGDLRAQLGLLSAGVYGIQMFAENGGKAFEVSDAEESPRQVVDAVGSGSVTTFNQSFTLSAGMVRDFHINPAFRVWQRYLSVSVPVMFASGSGVWMRLRSTNPDETFASTELGTVGAGSGVAGVIPYAPNHEPGALNRKFKLRFENTTGSSRDVHYGAPAEDLLPGAAYFWEGP